MIHKWTALLRFHYPGLDIEGLNEDQFWELVAEYRYVRKVKEGRLENTLKIAFAEVISRVVS